MAKIKNIKKACLLILLILTASFGFRSWQLSGVALCNPDAIESEDTYSGTKAEIHLCGGFVGYSYYLDITPSLTFEKKILFSENELYPKVQWIDKKNLKIILPKGINIYQKRASYAGVKIQYETVE